MEPCCSSLLLGVWLMATPAMLGTTGSSADVEHLAGALVLTWAVIAFGEIVRPVRLLNVLVGAGVAAAPWLLHGATDASRWNDIVVGIAVVISEPAARAYSAAVRRLESVPGPLASSTYSAPEVRHAGTEDIGTGSTRQASGQVTQHAGLSVCPRGIEHIREGKHGARSTKQAIAIGLSKARRAGVKLPPPKKGQASEQTRENAQRDYRAGQSGHSPSAKRSRAALRALKDEPRRVASHKALSDQARSAAARRRRTS